MSLRFWREGGTSNLFSQVSGWARGGVGRGENKRQVTDRSVISFAFLQCKVRNAPESEFGVGIWGRKGERPVTSCSSDIWRNTAMSGRHRSQAPIEVLKRGGGSDLVPLCNGLLGLSDDNYACACVLARSLLAVLSKPTSAQPFALSSNCCKSPAQIKIIIPRTEPGRPLLLTQRRWAAPSPAAQLTLACLLAWSWLLHNTAAQCRGGGVQVRQQPPTEVTRFACLLLASTCCCSCLLRFFPPLLSLSPTHSVCVWLTVWMYRIIYQGFLNVPIPSKHQLVQPSNGDK